MALPEWIKEEMRRASRLARERHTGQSVVRTSLKRHRVFTVCEEARCPNSTACFAKPTATFLILGDCCTRRCGFCAVSGGTPGPPDLDEPHRVAEAAGEMGLRYVVVTSVTRDDLPDGGASVFAATVRAVRARLPMAKIEVLTPDFRGDLLALQSVIESGPDVFNHNVETVERLYPTVRPQATYRRSLAVIERAKALSARIRTKSGLMVGLGEDFAEVVGVLEDLRRAGCGMVTIGQYLRPSKSNIPVVEYRNPGFFEQIRKCARDLGFDYVASGPLVRSSMNAEEMYREAGGGTDRRGSAIGSPAGMREEQL
jgi:lipoic acid synthetase